MAPRRPPVAPTRPRPRRGTRSKARPSRAARTPASGHIVAIGASAGGIAALQRLLGSLPEGFRAPILVTVHLDPGHPSSLAQLLQRVTKLRVRQASDGDSLRAGTVLVAPPARHLEVEGGVLRVRHSPKLRFHRPSIDRLFASVAREAGDRAIAVVLSGTGTDGAEGARAVKEREGTVLAEDRSTAAHPEMPEAVARTGAVDAVLPVDRIGPFLDRLLREDGLPVSSGQWGALLGLLRQRFGTDFAGYRATTLRRRLEKRLLATSMPDLASYLRLVERDPEELGRLHSAFLIKLSSFFRDQDAWRDLGAHAVKPLVKAAVREGREIRVWSAGCATGEEAYSAAMVFLEALPLEARDRLKVFATDLDDAALETARRGTYDLQQIRGVSPRQRKRFFTQEGSFVRVRKELRKVVIFGKHDLTRDPPIAGLDLLMCRNVVIYLGQDQKRAVLHNLSYALRPGGYLFLGKSEGLMDFADEYEPVAARSKLFRRADPHQAPLSATPGALAPRRGFTGREQALLEAVREGAAHMDTQEAFQHLLLRSASVLVVVLDPSRRVMLWNRAAEVFFDLPAGETLGRPALEVLEGISADTLAKAMKQSAVEMRTVSLHDVPVRGAGKVVRYLDLDVAPLGRRSEAGNRLVLVGTDVTSRHEGEARQRDLVAKLRHAAGEAARANESLQATNEELETLNEELQSSSEEQQTLNEELQSTNEELETTNEELQSTNEELNTVNEELRARTDELERVSSFLRSILDSTPDACVVCSDDHRVTFWSRGAARMFRVGDAQAVGQELGMLLPSLDSAALRQAVRRAVEERHPVSMGDVRTGLGKGQAAMTVVPATDRTGRTRGFILLARPTRRGKAGEEPEHTQDKPDNKPERAKGQS